ncbi:MAG: CHAP domain-containing protein [Mucilaginibacter polytrichastri]|nr:CHAP domain-containing protein [Mucilaginibacter polytrichastri]
MRFTDTEGQPLIVDGKIGAVTWTALFGSHSLPEPKPAKGLLLDVLGVAITQIGVQERPLGSNRGPEVDIFLKTVGLNPAAGSYAWCAAFVYWCFKQVSDKTGKPVSVPKTAGVLNMWNKAVQAGIKHIDTNTAVNNPLLIKPGFVFVMSFGRGTGHTGFVEGVEGGKLITIEGNTNDGGSREGIGVFRRNSRKINQINKGFIDFG